MNHHTPPNGLGHRNVHTIGNRTLPAYRHWVCTHLDGLLEGHDGFWALFRTWREALIRNPASRPHLAWEEPFLRAVRSRGPFRSRTALAKAAGLSADTLRRFEDAGLLEDVPPDPPPFGPPHLHRLHWLLFLSREIAVREPGLRAVLGLSGVRSRLRRIEDTQDARPIHHLRPGPAVQPRARAPATPPSAEASADARRMFHDLGNRLHVIAGRVHRVLRSPDLGSTHRRNLDIVSAQTREVDRLLRELRGATFPDVP